ncbi:MAG: hypothetical protein V2J62_04545 [candidate division KSB1 bacterium]|jgi:hypothetical protein|nr:hypothetical protein [candidate division KSB1 bacterium]
MKNQKALKIVNIILVVLLIWIMITVVIRDMIDRAVFDKIHPLGGFLFIICVSLHVVLNFGWIENTYFKKK